MEHSHLIVEPNVTLYIYIYIYIYWALYDNNIFELLEVCPNLTYYAKTYKFFNMFPNTKRTRSQIMNHMKYIYTKKSEEHINDKVQSSYVQFTLEEIKEPIFTQLLAKHDVQSNKINHNVNIKETTHNSIYINIYNKQIQNVPIIPCFNYERLSF
jgi:hypothetical protein